MAHPRQLVQTNELQTKQLSAMLKSGGIVVHTRHDDDLDTSFLMFVDPSIETVSHPVDDYVSLLYDPDSMEVVGMTIEAFALKFLRHGRRVWKLSEAGLQLEGGGEFALRFEKQKTWSKKELDVQSPSPNSREVEILEYA